MPHNAAAAFGFLSLPQGFARSGLPVEEIFQDYLLRGGRMGAVELEACLLGLLVIDPREHDIAALVLNEYFLRQPHCHLVAYATWTHPGARPCPDTGPPS